MLTITKQVPSSPSQNIVLGTATAEGLAERSGKVLSFCSLKRFLSAVICSLKRSEILKIVSSNALDAGIKCCCLKCGELLEDDICPYCEVKKVYRFITVLIFFGIVIISIFVGVIYQYHEQIGSFLSMLVDKFIFLFESSPKFIQGFILTFLFLLSIMLLFLL